MLAATLLAGCGGSSSGDDDDIESGVSGPTRATQQGEVEGVEQGDMLAFKGIPYAKPPVGELRYAAPEPAEAWETRLKATEFGGSCLQPQAEDSTFGAAGSTEDCLYLNVYQPEEANGDNAVMVWIHGGAFETGSGNAYDPAGLIDEGVVVVTINYRLGVLGFLSHPDLAAEDPNGYSGSWGLLDQQLALQWVHDNIENFGGNPDNVTIFGESAGGASVMSLVVSPTATELFDKAIVQSGAYTGSQPDQATVEGGGATFYQNLDSACSDIDCIRSLDASVIQAAQADADLDFVPSRRGDVMPDSISTALANDTYNMVPVMTGSNLDEWRLFVAIGELTRFAAGQSPEEAVLGRDDYAPEVASLLEVPETTAQMIIDNQYPLADYDNTSVAVGAVGTDAVFSCGALGQIGQMVGHNTVYAYEFTDRAAPKIIPEGNSFNLGAAHAFEIQYIFNSRESRLASLDDGGRGMTETQADLADAMTAYWANFAKSEDGNPNSTDGTGVSWPSVNSTGEMIELDPDGIATKSTTQFGDEHKCGFWGSFGSAT
ncbi:carboxylesterase/lipase family protein [Marinobacter zhanjiangensis]|uniref:carboxylesterase/lipase family protein n=1 Tax=Marinobacter zhanjiangensis TaxID=578215 RepID=UPI0016786D30|nr:carboxylesterase family protein [Marinobacter zhanjiangensis]